MINIAAIHPGVILKEELSAREISQALFSSHIKVSPAYLSDIIRGRRGVSAEMAIKIGRALGTSSDVWLNLQKQYELASVDQSDYEDIEELVA